jgi:hypothetical protein
MTCARSCSGTTSLAGASFARPTSAWPFAQARHRRRRTSPPDIISVPIVDWRLDRARLPQAVTLYAPDFDVIEVEQDGSVRALTIPPRRP